MVKQNEFQLGTVIIWQFSKRSITKKRKKKGNLVENYINIKEILFSGELPNVIIIKKSSFFFYFIFFIKLEWWIQNSNKVVILPQKTIKIK